MTIVIFCFVGMGLSALSLHNHYSTDPTDYCALDETFNCDLVNRSVYSRFLSVPVALIGLLGYVTLLAFLFWRDRTVSMLRTFAAWIGLGFSLYLTYIEDRVLGVWCLLCIGSLFAILVITAGFSVDLWKQRRSASLRNDDVECS